MVKWKQGCSLSNTCIVVFGEEWTGRSSTGNTILGRSQFPVDGSTEPLTLATGAFEDRLVTVVNTPGWEPDCSPKIPLRVLQRGCSYASQHTGHNIPALLLTVPICLQIQWNQKVVKRLLKLFNDNIWRHTILLFTKADLLDSMDLEKFLEGTGRPFQALIEKCEHRYHAFSNKRLNDRKQVKQLLAKIDQMVAENSGETFHLGEGNWDQEVLMSNQQIEHQDNLINFREREIIFRTPEECTISSLKHVEEYPDLLPEQSNLSQNQTRQDHVDMQDPLFENIHIQDHGNEPLAGNSSQKTSETTATLNMNSEQQLVNKCHNQDNVKESIDTQNAEKSTVMKQPNLHWFIQTDLQNDEKENNPENKSHPVDNKPEQTTDMFSADKTGAQENLCKCIEEANIDHVEQEDKQMRKEEKNKNTLTHSLILNIWGNQHGAVRIDVLQVSICWKNTKLCCQLVCVSFITFCGSTNWTLFMILIKLNQQQLIQLNQQQLNQQQLIKLNQQQLIKLNQQCELTENPTLMQKFCTENLNGDELQHSSKKKSDGGITQHSSTKKSDGGITQHSSKKKSDGGITQHSSKKKSDGGITQHSSKKKSDGGITQHSSKKKSDGGITQHSRKKKSDGGITQPSSKKSDGGITQLSSKKKSDEGITQHSSKKKSDGGITQHSSKKKSDGGITQHSSKKSDDKRLFQLHCKKNNRVTAQHDWKIYDEGKPKHDRRADEERNAEGRIKNEEIKQKNVKEKIKNQKQISVPVKNRIGPEDEQKTEERISSSHKLKLQADQNQGEKSGLREESGGGGGRKLLRSQSLERIIKLKRFQDEDDEDDEDVRKTRGCIKFRRSKSLRRFIEFTCNMI